MKISAIQNNQGSINVEADVVEVGETRNINKYGKNLRVSNAVIKDDSGSIKLTLWNEEIDKIHKGDRVKITNGYAKAFQDEIQLTAGKFGKIEVIGKAEAGSGEEGEDEGVDASPEKVARTNAPPKPAGEDDEDESEDAFEEEAW